MIRDSTNIKWVYEVRLSGSFDAVYHKHFILDYGWMKCT